jgi:hypothetical protein
MVDVILLFLYVTLEFKNLSTPLTSFAPCDDSYRGWEVGAP